MKKILSLAFAALLFGSCTKSVDVLIVTGLTDKYHSCDKMAPFIEKTLGEWSAFKTDVADMRDCSVEEFSPEFDKYDVVVLNFDEIEWSDKTKANFSEYVRSGGGVVVVHEASNAFPDWEEYNQITGLGGWDGRTESAGPYYYYRDGEYYRDETSPGVAGSHGKRAPYTVTVRDAEHPIMKGLPAEWLHINDELYSNMRGPIGDLHPLATAYSDSATGGSGKEEIVLFTVNHGKGRVFHCIFGHTEKNYDLSLKNRGFEVVLSRGTEWAATGKVTQTLNFEPMNLDDVEVEWIKGQPVATVKKRVE